MRKVLVNFDRNGFAYVLDRKTGELLQGRPVRARELGEEHRPQDRQAGRGSRRSGRRRRKNTKDICPSAMGGKNQQPVVVLAAHRASSTCRRNNLCMDYEGVEVKYQAGPALRRRDRGQQAGSRRQPRRVHRVGSERPARRCGASRRTLSAWGGALATGGDVVFYGHDGRLARRPVNAKTGDVLWKFKTPSGIIGNPMTYVGPDGKQYVAILSGIGGWSGIGVAADIEPRGSRAPASARIGAFRRPGQLQQPGRRADGLRAAVAVGSRSSGLGIGLSCSCSPARRLRSAGQGVRLRAEAGIASRRRKRIPRLRRSRRTCRPRTSSCRGSRTRSPSLTRERASARRRPTTVVGTAAAASSATR